MKTELIMRPGTASPAVQASLRRRLRRLLVESWGALPDSYFDVAVMNCDLLAVAHGPDGPLAFTSIVELKLDGRTIFFVNVSVVHPKARSQGLLFDMGLVLYRHALLQSFARHLSLTVDVMFLTPNVRVLGAMHPLSSFIYPDPSTFCSRERQVPDADDATWALAQKYLRDSWDPSRVLHRNGCVVEGSYRHTPWLIYNSDNAPKHRNEMFNAFAERYFEYSKASGKECIVRARLPLSRLLSYWARRQLSRALPLSKRRL
ncbi:MAG: hypothetical protein OXU20_42715 [Myxococcales bacterium]|nr:hypothetical protein [Myxococcales bacterium]